MSKRTDTATYSRGTKAGQWVVRKPSGEVTKHTVKTQAANSLSQSSGKHRDALKRLADR